MTIMRDIATRIAVAREIFTAEEIFQLYKYEFYLLWETAKKHVEWFAYALTVAVWIGVASLVVAIYKTSSMETEEYEVYPDAIEVAQPLRSKGAKVPRSLQIRESVEAAINEAKSEKSEVDSSLIYLKVLSYASKWRMNPSLLLAIIETESNFHAGAIAADYAKTGSVGWSQATKKTWTTFMNQYVMAPSGLGLNEDQAEEWKFCDATLSDIDKSLTFICWYVEWLQKHFPEKTKTSRDIYYCYNAGPYYKSVTKKMAANADRFEAALNRYYLAFK